MTDSPAQADEAFVRALRQFIANRFGSHLDELELLTGGASAQSWRLRVSPGLPGTGGRWILRRTPPSRDADQTYSDENRQNIAKATEAAVIRAVRHGDAPVPEIIGLLEGELLGEGYLMADVSGETIPRRILREDRFIEARKHLARQCGIALARIHAAATDELPELPERTGRQQLQQLQQLYRDFNSPEPAFEAAFVWLLEKLPTPDRLRLVHGDFRNGNLVVNEQGLAAILDWELCHLGEPALDIGWICVNSWRFGQRDRKVGGFGDLEQLLAGYREAGGTAPEPEQIRIWEIFGTLRWGVFCMLQAAAWLSGQSGSVEKAIIGRRVSETALDLSMLLAGEE